MHVAVRIAWKSSRALVLGLGVAAVALPAFAADEAPGTDEPLKVEAAAVDTAALDAQAGNTTPAGRYDEGATVAASDAPIGAYGQAQMPTSEIAVTSSAVSSSSLQATVAGGAVTLGTAGQ